MKQSCHYHPQQVLTNFCCTPKCSLPLCPKCINLHLSDQSTPHHLICWEEMLQMTCEQVSTALQGLHQERTLLQQNYDPTVIFEEYQSLLEKYRGEAIAAIDADYQRLSKQVLNELRCLAQTCLGEASRVEEKYKLLQTFQQQLARDSEALAAVISINASGEILQVQNLFASLNVCHTLSQQQKVRFGQSLPKLEPSSEPGKVILVPARMVAASDPAPERPAMASGWQTKENVNNLQMSRWDKISTLQQRLNFLRR